jgi:hypothetical protein
MDLGKIGCEDGSWMELAEDRVQWQALVLAVLNLLVLLPESLLITKIDLGGVCYGDRRGMEVAQDRVQWLAFALAVLNIRKLYKIPDSSKCCCRHATARVGHCALYHSHSVSHG